MTYFEAIKTLAAGITVDSPADIVLKDLEARAKAAHSMLLLMELEKARLCLFEVCENYCMDGPDSCGLYEHERDKVGCLNCENLKIKQ